MGITRRSQSLFFVAAAFAASLAASSPATARSERVATRLPLVTIDARARIADEPKVPARMRVIDRPGRSLNRPADRANVYRGRIGIEIRGHWSQTWDKKSFAVETRDRRGRDREVGLLGLPKESDWVLHATHGDRSLVRNALAFETTRRMGRYAPRLRHVELVLDGRYHGVYMLLEPLEIGKRRIAAADQTVLMELTAPEKVSAGDETFRSATSGALVSYADPDPDELAADRKAGMRALVDRFDAALHSPLAADPAAGWRRWLDERSAVDYILLQELFRNQDAFHASTHFHGQPGGRLVLGPPWDFDLSLGNAETPSLSSPTGWILSTRPWVTQLRDAALRRSLLERWRRLRAGGLREALLASLDRRTERLRAPARRNLARWPILRRGVFPSQQPRGSYRAEVRATRRWLDRRFAVLDGALAAAADAP
jgi:hypothetical protein